MALADEIAKAAAEALGPIAQNAVATVVKAIIPGLPAELASRLSGKVIDIKITIPDLTKPDDK